MKDKLDTLKTKAILAYIGWLKSDDTFKPMNDLRAELEKQGVDMDMAINLYESIKKN